MRVCCMYLVHGLFQHHTAFPKFYCSCHDKNRRFKNEKHLKTYLLAIPCRNYFFILLSNFIFHDTFSLHNLDLDSYFHVTYAILAVFDISDNFDHIFISFYSFSIPNSGYDPLRFFIFRHLISHRTIEVLQFPVKRSSTL